MSAVNVTVTLKTSDGQTTQRVIAGNRVVGTRKAIMRGICDRNTTPPANVQGIVTNSVIQPKWAQMEPSQGSYDFSAIVSELAQAKAAGVTAVELRPVMASQGAYPSWAEAKFGTYLAQDVQNLQNPPTPTLCYWAAQEAYQALHAAMGAEFDSNQMIVLFGLCYTSTLGEGEIFVRQGSDGGTRNAMLQGGYVQATDEAQVLSWPAIHAAHWPLTPAGTFNTKAYQTISAKGALGSDIGVNEQFYTNLGVDSRAAMGVNNSAPGTYVAPFNDPVYGMLSDWLKSGHVGHGQTVAAKRLPNGVTPDLATLATQGQKLGMTSEEFPSGYAAVSAATLKSINAGYAAV